MNVYTSLFLCVPFSFKIQLEKGTVILPKLPAPTSILIGNGQWNVLQLYHDQKPPAFLYFHEPSQSLGVSYHLSFHFMMFQGTRAFQKLCCVALESHTLSFVVNKQNSPCPTPRFFSEGGCSNYGVSDMSQREETDYVFRKGRRWFQSQLYFLLLRLKQDSEVQGYLLLVRQDSV